jgi:hypothetical protein
VQASGPKNPGSTPDYKEDVTEEQSYKLPFDAFQLFGIISLDVVQDRWVIF